MTIWTLKRLLRPICKVFGHEAPITEDAWQKLAASSGESWRNIAGVFEPSKYDWCSRCGYKIGEKKRDFYADRPDFVGVPHLRVKQGCQTSWTTRATHKLPPKVSVGTRMVPYFCACGCLQTVWTNLVADIGTELGVYAEGHSIWAK